ncbi:beta/gamma crystallin-related protein [Bradyrhizobium sp. SZCCHNRI1073]|uniref:beta/gamma crystallin-related protein n=1 Tax=Bradyrhizobium sp. SZCCHNRI1073 TaxID=3057280 RepID=UPI002916046B|nr:beta/gamma crystallin-related protein [Bradyrhizobium sp. SZCCHNRI1073]
MAQCILHWDENFTGNALVLNGSISNLSDRSGDLPGKDWNDETSSITINSGRWKFFEHVNFQGASMELGVGQYPNMHGFPVGDNQLSSVQLLSE